MHITFGLTISIFICVQVFFISFLISVNDLLLTSVGTAELATKSTCKKDTYRPSGEEKGAWLLFFPADHNVLLLKEKEKHHQRNLVHQLAFSFH